MDVSVLVANDACMRLETTGLYGACSCGGKAFCLHLTSYSINQQFHSDLSTHALSVYTLQHVFRHPTGAETETACRACRPKRHRTSGASRPGISQKGEEVPTHDHGAQRKSCNIAFAFSCSSASEFDQVHT